VRLLDRKPSQIRPAGTHAENTTFAIKIGHSDCEGRLSNKYLYAKPKMAMIA
jgi:hypothetical protein